MRILLGDAVERDGSFVAESADRTRFQMVYKQVSSLADSTAPFMEKLLMLHVSSPFKREYLDVMTRRQ